MVAVSGVDEIGMDLIRNHFDAVFQAYFTHCDKLFLRPDTPDRVMGTAEDKQLYPVLRYFIFKIVKIYVIPAVAIYQFVDYQFAVICADGTGKRIIDRLLDQDRVAFICQRADRGADGENDAGGLHEPLGGKVPVEPAGVPVGQCVEVIIAYSIAVAENAMAAFLNQRVQYLRRGREIHIGNP